MDDTRGLPHEYWPELRRARGALTVADEVGLALRDHRRQLGMSQRAYALTRGLSRAMLARLEAGAGRMSLDTVVAALEGTGFTLHVAFSADGPDPAPSGGAGARSAQDVSAGQSSVPLRRVPPAAWSPTDLVARVRGGGRRFPAHRKVLAVTNPPLWWWMHEFFNGPSERPKWYAPVCHLDLLSQPALEDEDPAEGAA